MHHGFYEKRSRPRYWRIKSDLKAVYYKMDFSNPYSIAFRNRAKGGPFTFCRQSKSASRSRKSRCARIKRTFRAKTGKLKCDRNEGFSALFFSLIFCTLFQLGFRSVFRFFSRSILTLCCHPYLSCARQIHAPYLTRCPYLARACQMHPLPVPT